MDLNEFQVIRKPGNQAYFSEIDQMLIAHIREAHRVYGCVAWLTHPGVLAALKGTRSLIVVQNEEWITPGSQIAQAYAELRAFTVATLNGVKVVEGYQSPAIRVLGAPGAPIGNLYHRFLILEGPNLYGVWTGSFGLAPETKSFENALFITDTHIVEGYRQEFCRLLTLSCEIGEPWVPQKHFELSGLTGVLSVSGEQSAEKQSAEKQSAEKQSVISESLMNGAGEVLKVAAPLVAKAILYYSVGGCARCGRPSHGILQCYARTDITGKPL